MGGRAPVKIAKVTCQCGREREVRYNYPSQLENAKRKKCRLCCNHTPQKYREKGSRWVTSHRAKCGKVVVEGGSGIRCRREYWECPHEWECLELADALEWGGWKFAGEEGWDCQLYLQEYITKQGDGDGTGYKSEYGRIKAALLG